jgi:Flp pilus assembly pilin Flp
MEAEVVKKRMAWLGKRGASSIEYTIIAAVISMAIVVGATGIGQKVGLIYNSVGNSIPK